MAFEFSVIVAGVEYSLTDGTYCHYAGDDGLGMAPAHRLVERGPLQHGQSDRGFRLDPRLFRLILEIDGTTWENLWTKRHTLENIFKPASDPLKFRWTFDTYTRQIDAYFVGDMRGPSSERRGFTQAMVIDFEAPDPSFYDPTAQAVTFNLGGGSDTGAVPSAVPTLVGVSTLDATEVINYSGSWLSYPTLVRITGPITDAVITNNSTDEKLDFTGITIAGGDYYDIDLRYGHKTVVDSSGVNKIADLTDDSDLATWHLAADPEVGSGLNSINVTGSAVTASTKVEITYLIRYMGI